jgi:hypothetical protein
MKCSSVSANLSANGFMPAGLVPDRRPCREESEMSPSDAAVE